MSHLTAYGKRSIALSVFMVLSLSLILLAGCDKIDLFKSPNKPVAPRVKGTVIAKVNDYPITLEELNRQVDIYNSSIDLLKNVSEADRENAKIKTREQKLTYLNELLIPQAVFYQAALDRGMDRKDEIIDAMERYKIALLSEEMQREIVKDIDMSQAEAEAAYNQYKEAALKEAQKRRVRMIVAGSEQDAKQISLELLQAGADFAALARSRSIDEATKVKDGDLGEISIGDPRIAGFDDIVFSPNLQQGQVSNYFKGPKDRYYIFKIEGIKEGEILPLSEAKDRLLALKRRSELQKAYGPLSTEKTKIVVYDGEVK